jgi:hypothetical protein
MLGVSKSGERGQKMILSLRLTAHEFRVEKYRPLYPYRRRRLTLASRTTSGGGDYNLSDPVNSFVDVVRRVLLQPASFFAGLPRQGNFLGPLVFALICIEISAIITGLLTFIDVPGGITTVLGARGDQGFLAFLGGLIIVPIAGTVGVFLTALVTHLLVLLVVGSGHSGFGATFRIVSYSSVTSLIGWIPFIGWIFSLYRIYLATVGVREMHSTTTGRALLVVLLPAILVLLLVLVLLGASGIVYFRAV